MRLRVVGFWLAGVVSALLAAWFLTVPATSPGSPLLPPAVGTPSSAEVSRPRTEASLRAATPPASRQPSKAVLTRALDALPLRFESNVGQTDERARFIARGPRSTLFLTSSEAVLALAAEGGRQSALKLSFAGASGSPAVTGEQELPGRTHYLKGTESEWKRDIASYARVRYEAVYPGVDVVFYGKGRELEFDVVVASEADPTQIAIEIAGAEGAHIDEAGDLKLDLSAGQVRMKRPVAYQEVRGQRQPVESEFVLSGNRVGFRVGAYDRSEPLVIDPVILFSTYLGGSSDDTIRGIGLDASGHVYISGWTSSSDFPTAAAFDNRLNGTDAFVAKLAPDGSSLIYSTYLGGAQDPATVFGEMELGLDVAVDSAGHAYVTGRTNSPDFPLTPSAYDLTPNGGHDVFLTKLSADGSALLYSTLIGTSGPDLGVDVAVDDSGSAYVLGQIGGPAFPLTSDAYSQDGSFFLSRFNTMAAGAASLEYSTFAGIFTTGSFDIRMDIAPDGDVLIAGSHLFVNAVNGFQTSKAIDPRFGLPSGDAAFLRVDTRAADPNQAVVYASYLGGNALEMAWGIGAGPGGLVCLVGGAESADFPARSAFQPVVAGNLDAFVAMFDTSRQGDASLVYSTLLGGFGTDEATHCDFDTAGNLRVAGNTSSTDFPLRAPFQATSDGSGDVFLANFDRSLAGDASLVTSSYYGGSRQEITRAFALDGAGGVWVGGTTTSTNLPIAGAIQPAARGREDGFLARIGEPGGGGGGGGGAPQLMVSAAAPNRGGAAAVTVVVHGAGFENGATVTIARGGESVLGDPVKFIDGNALQATMDLSGRALGAWDIVVTNPGGTTATLAGGFTIEPVTAVIRASASVVMNPIQRFGRAAGGYITYSNPTNVDVMLPIFIYFPHGKTLDFGIPIRHGPTIVTDPPADFSQMPQVFDTGTEQVIPLIVNVPPGHTGVIPISIRQGCDPLNPTPVRVVTGTPKTRTEAMTCATALIGLVLDAIPLTDCVGDILGLLNRAVGAYTGQPASMGSWIADVLLAAVKCVAATVPVSAAITAAIKVTEIIAFADDTLGALSACNGGMRPSGPGSVAADRSCVRSADPNAKYGPAGAGEARYITGADAMTYAIAFENLPTATAAAQDVVVTDTLDPARLDLDTFVLGPVSFGGRTVVPPAGLSAWVTTVDLRPAVNLLLKIDAKLDRATSVATWRYTSLDPATGQPTTDPLAGFLPPNVTSPEGEGTVMFTADPVALLGTGDVIRNSASIVFDVNAPIDTGEWTNAIDKMAPASTVLLLASPQSPSFEVRWSGTDAGSGVTDYTVFAAVNGGPFVPWLSNTTATSATYHGAPGNTYGFFSIARDGVGLVEAVKTTPEALVEIALDTQPPTTSASTAPNAARWLSVNQVVVALTAVDGDSGVREIVYRASGATTLPPTTVAGAATSVAIFLEGETTIAFYAVDNAGNIESEHSLVIRIDRTAPQITCASSPGVLWPPNQKMVDVTTSVDVSDALSGAAGFMLLSATSNEPDEAFDDLQGWVIGSADSRGRLRAERMGAGQGRVYSLRYQGSDAAGNTATCSANIIVPHDRRR